MARSIRIHRMSNRAKDHHAEHLEAVRAAIAHGKGILGDSAVADTFAGRKTQESFADENKVK